MLPKLTSRHSAPFPAHSAMEREEGPIQVYLSLLSQLCVRNFFLLITKEFHKMLHRHLSDPGSDMSVAAFEALMVSSTLEEPTSRTLTEAAEHHRVAPFISSSYLQERDAYANTHAILGAALGSIANVTIVSSTDEQARQLLRAMEQAAHYPGAMHWATSVHKWQRTGQAPGLIGRTGGRSTLALGSMDVVVIASVHVEKEQAMLTYWPYVRPGGCLCIEDVPVYSNSSGFLQRADAGWSPIAHAPWSLQPEVARILEEHDDFLVDVLRGMRLSAKQPPTRNNTHMLVVRKRTTGRSPVILRHSGVTAMQDAKVSAQLPWNRSQAMDLEALAFYYGTDKSRDDHKYTDLYALLFDARRHSVLNMTEIGIMSGQVSPLLSRNNSRHATTYSAIRSLTRRLGSLIGSRCSSGTTTSPMRASGGQITGSALWFSSTSSRSRRGCSCSCRTHRIRIVWRRSSWRRSVWT